jgi:hypothetical protein
MPLLTATMYSCLHVKSCTAVMTALTLTGCRSHTTFIANCRKSNMDCPSHLHFALPTRCNANRLYCPHNCSHLDRLSQPHHLHSQLQQACYQVINCHIGCSNCKDLTA